MKRVLVVDDSYAAQSVRDIAERMGCEVTILDKPDFTDIKEAIFRKNFDLLILAKEMRIAGPALGELVEMVKSNPASKREIPNKLHEIEVDFKFGTKVFEKLTEHDILLPIIYLTTADLDKPKWHFGKDGKLWYGVICKCYRGFFDDVQFAIARSLGMPEEDEQEGDFLTGESK